MLRILILLVFGGIPLVTASWVWAADPNREELQTATTRSQEAIDEARRLSQDADFTHQLRNEGEHATSAAKRVYQNMISGTVGTDFPVINSTTLTKAQEDIRALLENPQLTVPHTVADDPPPLVFISFSVPEESLRALLRDAVRTGSPLVLRGMVDNSMKRTMERIGELLGNGKSDKDVVDGPAPSLAVDPTLFERFAVDKVPTFVLPLETAAPCTPSDCPVPDHLKLAGDVSLAYALDVMARGAAGTPLGKRAEQWHRQVEGQP